MSEPSLESELDRFEKLQEIIYAQISEIMTEFSIPDAKHQEIYRNVREIWNKSGEIFQIRYFRIQLKEICLAAAYSICKCTTIPIPFGKIHGYLTNRASIRSFHKYLTLFYQPKSKQTKKDSILTLINESPFPDWIKPMANRLVSAYPITICNTTEKIGAATAIATSVILSAPSKEWEIPIEAIAAEFGVSISAIYCRKMKIFETIRIKTPELLEREQTEFNVEAN
jgi:hypothetical protein